MIRVQCVDGEYFDIGITGYEFPDSNDRSYDGNWLNVCLDLHSQRGTARATCPVLLTWDVEAIVQWFRDLLEGKEIEGNPIGSIEPNLEMEYVDRIGDKWIIRFRFAVEFKPDDVPEDESFYLTAELDAAQIGQIADSFAETLTMFPKRVHKPSEVTSLLRKVRVWLVLFIVGLVLAGLSAMPIRAEVQWLERITEALDVARWWPAMAAWISRVHDGVMEAGREQPFLFYGTDWLAFGHFMLAVMFLGSLRDPVRNLWVVHAGMVACVLVIPWAFLFGPVRGIPFFWQLIDCSFGVLGIIPLYVASHYTRRIIALEAQPPSRQQSDRGSAGPPDDRAESTDADQQ